MFLRQMYSGGLGKAALKEIL